MSKEEQLLFRSTSEHLVEIVGTQFYDAETDRYFEVTRVQFIDSLYCLYGIPITIPELADTSQAETAAYFSAVEEQNDRLRARVDELERNDSKLRTACVLALAALRARREVEEHTAEAAQYDSCPDCCNQRPCAEFARRETHAQNAAATAMAALRGALARGRGRDHE